jgi:hypothetical protein
MGTTLEGVVEGNCRARKGARGDIRGGTTS